jgi:hypothetical protein
VIYWEQSSFFNLISARIRVCLLLRTLLNLTKIMFEEMIILMTCQAAQKPEAWGVQPEVLGGEERTKVCFGVTWYVMLS